MTVHQNDRVERVKRKIKNGKSQDRKNLIILIHQKNQDIRIADGHGHAVIPPGIVEERDREAFQRETEDEIAPAVNHQGGECDDIKILWIYEINIFIHILIHFFYKFTSTINLGKQVNICTVDIY